MITINHINGSIAEKDLKKVPKTFVAQHSTGSAWIYFETTEEYEAYKKENFNINELQNLKNSLLILVDEKTTENIFKGFVFDNNTFSMSLSAQINLSNIFNIPDELFPFPYSTKDDKVYSLSLANRQNFYLAALAYKNSCIQQGNTLKQQLLSTTTIEELKAIKL